MKLIDQIRKDKIVTMRARDKVRLDLLRSVEGWITTASKGSNNAMGVTGDAAFDDKNVLQVLTKTAKNMSQTIQTLKDSGRDFVKETRELKILQEYLPQQMSSEELEGAILTIIESIEDPSMGAIMKELKSQHGSSFDGKAASVLVRSILQRG